MNFGKSERKIAFFYPHLISLFCALKTQGFCGTHPLKHFLEGCCQKNHKRPGHPPHLPPTQLKKGHPARATSLYWAIFALHRRYFWTGFPPSENPANPRSDLQEIEKSGCRLANTTERR
jgi:hypothetical protein